MNLINQIYRTSHLAKNGIFILVSLLVLIILGPLFIPEFEVKEIGEQPFSINGLSVKNQDKAIVTSFIRSIKANNGYLCLGTSESAPHGGGNYYDFLNADETIRPQFSIMTGAGRTCGVTIPLWINFKEEVKDLNVIYVINPVYWREDLAQVNSYYWKRYNSIQVLQNINPETQSQFYFEPVKEYMDQLNQFEISVMRTNSFLRNIRRSYFQDFNLHLNPNKIDSFYTYHNTHLDSNYTQFMSNPGFDVNEIDTTYNIKKSFENKHWFKSIASNEDYRYRELEAFIKLSKALGVNVTFVMEPINEIFISAYKPKSLSGYLVTENRIKHILESNNCDFIDARNLSKVTGAFDDHQHHSSYGAYLLAQKIKNHVDNK